jgi:hypothetical protein
MAMPIARQRALSTSAAKSTTSRTEQGMGGAATELESDVTCAPGGRRRREFFRRSRMTGCAGSGMAVGATQSASAVVTGGGWASWPGSVAAPVVLPVEKRVASRRSMAEPSWRVMFGTKRL